MRRCVQYGLTIHYTVHVHFFVQYICVDAIGLTKVCVGFDLMCTELIFCGL
jgi:hypothetical protein